MAGLGMVRRPSPPPFAFGWTCLTSHVVRTQRPCSGRRSLTGDGSHITQYDSDVAGTMLGEAAWLLRALGFAAKHTILIGGLVPGLLVLDPGPSRPKHIGTTDLDLCLSVALVEGDTTEYERIE